MNKALANAIRQGRVISEDETGKRGLLYSVVRVKGSPPIRLRSEEGHATLSRRFRQAS